METLRKILGWTIGLPLALIIIALAVANRSTVRFSLDPISRADPFLSVEMPLFVLLLLAAFIGLLTGLVAMWLNQHKWRKRARVSRDEAAHWREQARARHQAQPDTNASEPAASDRMLPSRDTAA